MMSMDKTPEKKSYLNIGVLGSGFMGRMRSHAYSVAGTIFGDLEISPRLFAVASLDEDGIQSFARRFNYQHYTNDWRDIVQHPEIDVVNICLPEHLHEETVIAALKAGKHVFCEKALSLSLSSCKKMVSESEKSGRLSMVGFNYRFLPALQLARNMIKDGLLGDLYYAECRYFQESGHDPNRPVEEVLHAFGENPLGSAKGLGSHVADTLRFLVGDFTSVQAIFKTFLPVRYKRNGDEYTVRTDDFAAMTVEFACGAVGILSTSKIATGRKNQMYLEINGSKGSLTFDAEAPNILHVYLDDAHSTALRGFTKINVTEKCHPLMEAWWPPAHNLGFEHSHINEIHYFVKCIQENSPIGPMGGTFEDGLEAIRLIEYACRSDRENRKIMFSAMNE